MTNRTQRLFCFVVALVVAGAPPTLQAQVVSGGSTGTFPGSPGPAGVLLNPGPVPATPGALSSPVLVTGPAKYLDSKLGEKTGVLPDYGAISSNLSVFPARMSASGISPEMAVPVTAAGLTRQFIPSNNYYIQSGFFCKREWEMERSTHIPFRFRLGSLAQCNALEGKP